MRPTLLAALRVGLLLACAAVITGCHDLVNPVDPNSTSYGGEPVLRDPLEPPRVLPEVIAWRIVVDYDPGLDYSLSRYFGFDIPSDGSLVEPRDPAGGRRFIVMATFADLPDEADFEGGLYLWGYTDPSGTTFDYIYPDTEVPFEPATNTFRLVIDPAPVAARVRIKLIDRNGRVAGETIFGFLVGDFSGDGVVTLVDDVDSPGGVESYAGTIADGNSEVSIRADLNASGTVNSSGPGQIDYDIASGAVGAVDLNTLPFPEF
ncbi:MAG: hypothetical protein ACOCW3_05325 [Spirochaetota bacterium]